MLLTSLPIRLVKEYRPTARAKLIHAKDQSKIRFQSHVGASLISGDWTLNGSCLEHLIHGRWRANLGIGCVGREQEV